jgi:hypothetical protein
VALSGEALAVVAGGPGRQRLYLYRHDSSSGRAELERTFELDPGGARYRLAVEAGMVVLGVGEAGGDPAEGMPGHVRTFIRRDSQWLEGDAPAQPEPLPPGCFGCSLALEEDLLLVGAPAPLGGQALLYRHSAQGWVLEERFEGPGGHDFFGESVELRGGLALVGAPGTDEPGDNSGAVYVYEAAGDAWPAVGVITAPDAVAFEGFGAHIALANGEVVVGAPGRKSAAGAVYVVPLGSLAAPDGTGAGDR